LSASAASPQLSGTSILLTATSTTCANPRYEFWFQPPGGSWRVVQGYSSSSTFNWNTAGTPPGTYLFSVWARDASSPGTRGTAPNRYDAFTTVPYRLT
jgi:hypothetical protein